MADIKTAEERSKNMAAVKSSNTKIELRLRHALWKLGYRYIVKNSLPGTPDIVFTKKKVVVFCDGCFWHGCPKCYSLPESNKNYWCGRLAENKARDARVSEVLSKNGWRVLRFWGCQIKRELPEVIKIIEEELKK